MSKIRVGVIFGGESSEHEVSLQSAKNIVDAIDREKYDVVLIGIDKEGNWHKNEESSYLINPDNPASIQLNKTNNCVGIVPGRKENQIIYAQNANILEQVDVIFPIVHGTLGEDGSLQGLLRIANIPFVGPNVLGSSICMDKDITKRLLKGADIQVAKGVSFTRGKKDSINFHQIKDNLGTPMFIKPANQGSSVGVSKVESEEEFEEAVDLAFQYDHKILIEENIIGREIEVSVLGNENPKASIPGEILPQTEFYSYESKYINESGAKLSIPAELSAEMVDKIKNTAIDVFTTLECEGLARVDFFLTANGELYVNEVNTLPGFTRISMYPKLWEQSGITITNLITELIELALERHEKERYVKKLLNK